MPDLAAQTEAVLGSSSVFPVDEATQDRARRWVQRYDDPEVLLMMLGLAPSPPPLRPYRSH